MRIGEMVRRTGVSERLLRYYEEQGLLTPDRLPSGYRVYAEGDVETVRRVRTLLNAGLTTATIARVLPCVREEGSDWCRSAPAWSPNSAVSASGSPEPSTTCSPRAPSWTASSRLPEQLVQVVGEDGERRVPRALSAQHA